MISFLKEPRGVLKILDTSRARMVWQEASDKKKISPHKLTYCLHAQELWWSWCFGSRCQESVFIDQMTLETREHQWFVARGVDKDLKPFYRKIDGLGDQSLAEVFPRLYNLNFKLAIVHFLNTNGFDALKSRRMLHDEIVDQ